MLQFRLMKSIIQKIPFEITVILIIFVVFFAGYLFVARADEGEPEMTHFLSTYEQGVYGSSRLFGLIDNLDLKAGVNTENYFGEVPVETGLIFILSPEIEFKYQEQVSIRDWVESGGILVYGCDIGKLIDHSRKDEVSLGGIEISPPWKIPEVVHWKISDLDGHLEFNPDGLDEGIKVASILPVDPDMVSQDVNSIQAPYFYFEESIKRPVFHITTYETSEEDSEENELELENEERIAKEAEWEILATDDEDPSIIERKIGEGRIIAVANPLIFANGFIEAGDNIMFAYNLISSVDEDKIIIFDEYSHGNNTSAARSILDTGWGRVFALVLFTGILAVYSKAVRFIPPKAIPPPERRSQVEYLQSMAQILRRAKALKVVIRIMLRDCRNMPVGNARIKQLKVILENESNSNKPSTSKIMRAMNELISLEK